MKTLLTVVAGILMACPLLSQSISPEVYATSGTVFSNPNAQLSWTMGECLVASRTDGSILLTEGYQQARYFITAITDGQEMEWEVQIFPNPTTDFLHLNFNKAPQQGGQVELFNTAGQVVWSKRTEPNSKSETFSLDSVSDGSYFLRVTDLQNHRTRNFQVRKIQ